MPISSPPAPTASEIWGYTERELTNLNTHFFGATYSVPAGSTVIMTPIDVGDMKDGDVYLTVLAAMINTGATASYVEVLRYVNYLGLTFEVSLGKVTGAGVIAIESGTAIIWRKASNDYQILKVRMYNADTVSKSAYIHMGMIRFRA